MANKNKNKLGDTEKTILVGAVVVAFWLGVDAYAKRAEQKDAQKQEDGQQGTRRIVQLRMGGIGGRR